MSYLLHPFRTFGLGPGFVYGLSQLLIRLGLRSRIRFYEVTRQPIPPTSSTRKRSITVRQLHEGDTVLTQIPRPPHVVAARYAQNAICLAAFKDKKLIGFQWLSIGPYEEDEVRCRFVPPEKSAFDFDIYVFPEYRLGFGFLSLWEHANSYMRERGIEYTFSRISRFNTTSLQAHRRLKCTTIGRAIFLSGPKRQLMISTLPPYIHYSNGDTRPDIVIRGTPS